jgi:hypothetical protein
MKVERFQPVADLNRSNGGTQSDQTAANRKQRDLQAIRKFPARRRKYLS